jgi:hypothetical protein
MVILNLHLQFEKSELTQAGFPPGGEQGKQSTSDGSMVRQE